MSRAPRATRLALVPAAALALAPVAAAAAEPRLFTTAEQRERLDQLRAEATAEELAQAAEPEPEPEAQATRPAEPPPPPRVHLRGFIRRSDGPSAVWVNEGSTIQGIGEGIRIDSGQIRGDSVVVRLPDGRRVRLKPGQEWDPERGEVVDVGGR